MFESYVADSAVIEFCVLSMHVPIWVHVFPTAHVPQVPPHRSSPHIFVAQFVVLGSVPPEHAP